jgi:hypothetical protein
MADLVARRCVQVGLPEIAREFVRRGVIRSPCEEAATLAARGILAEADGEAAASDLLRSAAIRYGELNLLPNQALALQALGRCLLGQGATEEGVPPLVEAKSLWQKMKANLRVNEIDALLDSSRGSGGNQL